MANTQIDDYSWGEFFNTVSTCDEYTDEQKKKFAVFEALDKAETLQEIRKITKSLSEEQINWLNSPCLDGIIKSVNSINPIKKLLEQKQEYLETYKYYFSKKLAKRYLIRVIRNGYIEIVKFLISKGADPQFDTGIPLYEAAQHGYIEIVKLLLFYGTKGIDDALAAACSGGHIDIVKLLLEYGADIHYTNELALREACDAGYIEIAKFLLEKGADIHINKNFMLCIASSRNRVEIAEFLLEHKADIHHNDNEPLFSALQKGHTEIAKFLLEKGADFTTRNTNYMLFIINTIIDENYIDTFKLLVDKKVNIDDAIIYSLTKQNRKEMIKILFEANIEFSDNNIYCALLYACKHNYPEIVKLLRNKATAAIQKAVNDNSYTTIKTLLDYGINFDDIKIDFIKKNYKTLV